MRALILVLITLNLALAAWSWHYDKLSSHDDISSAAEIPLPEVETYSELEEGDSSSSDSSDDRPEASPPATVSVPEEVAESPSAAVEESAEQPVPVAPKPQPKEVAVSPPAPAKVVPASIPKEPAKAEPIKPQPSATSKPAVASSASPASAVTGCIAYGPFDRAVDAAKLVQRMQGDGYAAEFRERNERVHRGRWVLFPVASTAEAEALKAAFADAGLKDFGLVRKSPLGMAVSAGLYAGERSLNARLDSLLRAGFTPEVDNLYRDDSFYEVTVEEAPADPEKYGKFLACNA